MVIDSFEGLSQPTREDSSKFVLNPELFAGEYIAPAGTFDCPQEALSSLPEKPILLCTFILISMIPFEMQSTIYALD
jgi:hypothetical protein